MFDTSKLYLYKHSYVHVGSPKDGKICDKLMYTDKDEIYLGKFKQFSCTVWGHEFIKDGNAIFEYGQINFSNYGNICLCLEKKPVVNEKSPIIS